MKTIQITIDEKLLAKLDAVDEVRQVGRSAVFRRAVSEYLERQRRTEITNRYTQAYGSGASLGDEFERWEDEATWLSE